MHSICLPEMPRRGFMAIIAGGLLAAPLAAEAQPAGKGFRVGVLVHGRSPSQPPTPEQLAQSPLQQGLQSRGWVVGQSVVIEPVFSEGRADRLAELAADLVRRRVDVIWCSGPPSAVAAARATKTIPIVFWGVAFPVELGLVASLARPGGNVTGFAYSAGPEITLKQIELLKAAAPRTTRIASLSGVSAIQTVGGASFRPSEVFASTFQRLGLEVRHFPLETREGVDHVFSDITDWRAEAIAVFGDPATWTERRRIADFASRNRLPSVSGMSDFVVVGGLISYGPNTTETIRSSAFYLDRILKGAKPSDLPVEQPTKFELVINLKTAKALGLTIPPSLLQRADQVIE
jgi:ABC-type uncharacterized transport system substrate-binding protein